MLTKADHIFSASPALFFTHKNSIKSGPTGRKPAQLGDTDSSQPWRRQHVPLLPFFHSPKKAHKSYSLSTLSERVLHEHHFLPKLDHFGYFLKEIFTYSVYFCAPIRIFAIFESESANSCWDCLLCCEATPTQWTTMALRNENNFSGGLTPPWHYFPCAKCV